MFGTQRKKATKIATQAAKQIVSTVELGGMRSLPEDFWHDAYVLGYLYGVIVSFVAACMPEEQDLNKHGDAVIEALDKLSNDTKVAERVNNFLDRKDPDFLAGWTNADKVVDITYNIRDHSDDPDVQRARKKASEYGGGNDAVSGALSQILFYDKVRDRLN